MFQSPPTRQFLCFFQSRQTMTNLSVESRQYRGIVKFCVSSQKWPTESNGSWLVSYPFVSSLHFNQAKWGYPQKTFASSLAVQWHQQVPKHTPRRGRQAPRGGVKASVEDDQCTNNLRAIGCKTWRWEAARKMSPIHPPVFNIICLVYPFFHELVGISLQLLAPQEQQRQEAILPLAYSAASAKITIQGQGPSTFLRGEASECHHRNKCNNNNTELI